MTEGLQATKETLVYLIKFFNNFLKYHEFLLM